MRRTAVMLAVAAVVLASNAALVEGAGSRKGAKGVVEVEYRMAASGSSGGRQWRGTRTVTLAFDVAARELQAKPVTLMGAPTGQKSFAGRAGATGKKHEKTLGKMEAAIAKCKGDEDCEMRVAMEFMGSDDGSAMMADTMAIAREASGEDGGPRYQLWSPAGPGGKPLAVSGTYAIDQWEKVRVDDPGCTRTGGICTTETETKGAGPLPPGALAMFAAALTGEVPMAGVVLDTQERLFTLGLPQPVGLVVDVTEKTTSSQTGTSSTKKSVGWLAQVQAWQGLGVADLSYPEPLRELRGEIAKDVAQGYGDKMTIRWRFAVKP